MDPTPDIDISGPSATMNEAKRHRLLASLQPDLLGLGESTQCVLMTIFHRQQSYS
jgi:hypothetical protein